MNRSLLIVRRDRAERDALAWAATPPEVRASLRLLWQRVEADRAARALSGAVKASRPVRS